MLHEQFVRYLNALHKLYLAHHDSNCACDCVFCDSCEEIDHFDVSWLMGHMLCTPLLGFPGSTIRLYSWDCIENKSGTIFECPSFDLLSDTDEIKFEVYSEVHLTRQSLSACATGTTMSGTLIFVFLS